MKTITLPKKPQRIRDLFIAAFKISNATIIYTLPFFIIAILLNISVNILTAWLQEAENQNNIGLIVVAALLSIIFFLGMLAMFASVIYRINSMTHHKNPSFNSCFLMGCKRVLPLFLVSLIYGLSILIGTVLLVIPGIMAAIYFVFATYLVVLGAGIIDSMKESYRLVKDNWWRTFLNIFLLCLAMFVFVLIVYGLLVLVGVGTQLLMGSEHELGLGFIIVTTIVFMIMLILIYNYSISFILACLYDLQIRKGSKD